MKPACRTIGRERQRLEDIAPNNPISEECWIPVSLPPPTNSAQHSLHEIMPAQGARFPDVSADYRSTDAAGLARRVLCLRRRSPNLFAWAAQFRRFLIGKTEPVHAGPTQSGFEGPLARARGRSGLPHLTYFGHQGSCLVAEFCTASSIFVPSPRRDRVGRAYRTARVTRIVVLIFRQKIAEGPGRVCRSGVRPSPWSLVLALDEHRIKITFPRSIQRGADAPANLPSRARWFPQGDAATSATKRVARASALLGQTDEGLS